LQHVLGKVEALFPLITACHRHRNPLAMRSHQSVCGIVVGGSGMCQCAWQFPYPGNHTIWTNRVSRRAKVTTWALTSTRPLIKLPPFVISSLEPAKGSAADERESTQEERAQSFPRYPRGEEG